MSLLFPEQRLIGLASTGQGAIAALRTQELSSRCSVTVVLSNHLVRYAVVPWSSTLAGEAEEEAYVRHHFGRIHGERAKSWALRWTMQGNPRLASAIDKALLEDVKNFFVKGGKARLVSVQPHLMAAYHRARTAIPSSGAWLAVVEPDRACVALITRGRFRAIENVRGEWRDVLERMRHRIEGEVPDVVLVAGPGLTDTAAPTKFVLGKVQ